MVYDGYMVRFITSMWYGLQRIYGTVQCGYPEVY